MRIGIDLDGVVYDWVDALRRFLVDNGRSADEFPPPTTWNFWGEWGLTEHEFWDATGRGIEAGVIFGTGDPIPGSADVISDLVCDGHKVHIVTARRRNQAAAELTLRWLTCQGIPYHSLTFSHDKTIVPVDVFIEDNVDNAREVDRRPGSMAILLDQPWNQGAPDLLRARDWHEVARLIDVVDRLVERGMLL